MDWITENLGLSEATQGKLIASLVLVVSLVAIRRLALRAIHARVELDEDVYRARKILTYVATMVALVSLGFIWLDAFDNLPTYLGLLSAGIAIGLSDLLKNIAGWAYILGRRPFSVGDRVEIAGVTGDVVDIRLFRFSLMEVRGWVDADQSTGRLVHVPNGKVFTDSVANYTEGFNFVWHEIPVLITFESDRQRGEEIIREALAERAPEMEIEAERRIRETARKYHIKIGTLTPTVYLTVRDSGVLLTARFLTHARHRRGAEDAIWRRVLDALDAEPSVNLAYPTIRTYFEGPIEVSRPQPDGG